MTHYKNIPAELKNLNQWVCACSDSKVPMRAFESAAASSTNPATWSPFDTALNAVLEGYYDYCGFVFADNGLVGIDIDIGYDADGLLTPQAACIIGKCQSYTEKSRSGRGFHIILRGQLPFKGKNNLAGVEIYKAVRYFILTGDTQLYREIVENQAAIDYIVEKYFPDDTRQAERNTSKSRIYSPKWEAPVGTRIKLHPNYSSIPQGCRNLSLLSLGGRLHNDGYSGEQIFEELRRCNAVACKPPLDDWEVLNIVKSVTKYKR